MASWSSRRKLGYTSLVVGVLIILIGIPAFLVLHKTPTCTDGLLNGDETGIDCGGSCIRLCQSSFLPPKIGWGGAKFEKVADGLYNVASLIINQNINGAALKVPYKISLFDKEGVLIVERKGITTLYAHRNSLAFEPAVQVGKRIPAKATFEFTQAPVWFKSHDALTGLAIIDKEYKEDSTSSSLEVTLENKSLFPIQDLDVAVVLYDTEGNAIGFSRTNIDILNANNDREVAPFTWPMNRDGKVNSIEVIPIIAPTFDR
jgi:hypothetical protein